MPGPLDTNGWPEFRNENASAVPAFGCMRVTDTMTLSDGRVMFKADQPSRYGCVGDCMINGPVDVAGLDGSTYSYGCCNRSGIILALYDIADGTPAYGDEWGPRSG